MHVTPRSTGLHAFLVALLLAVFASPAAAQTTGKIEGRVYDQATGAPLAGAQVVVVGTNLGNLTNQDGYYFINNVPAGLHNVQSQYIGYQSVTVEDQRVLAGQTMTVDFRLPTQAVALEAITVRGQSNVLVPRDKTVSKAIVTGDVVQQLPVNDLAEVVALQPGVIRYGGQFVIRGGRPGEASVYIDGVLVRKFNAGDESGNFELGTNAVEEVNVLTGGYGAEYGNAQSGVVNYVTKSGGTNYSGAVSFGTDEILPNSVSYGRNRLEASLGGPIPALARSSFHFALTAEGMEDRGARFTDMLGADSIPVRNVYFRPVGKADYIGDDGKPVRGADGQPLQYTEFEEFDGLGPRLPYNNADNYTLSGSLIFNPFQNTKVTFGTVQSRAQNLGFENQFQFRPKAISANVSTTDLYRIGVDQVLLQSAERQAALSVKLAYIKDRAQGGLRADTAALEPEGTDFLGFKFGAYELLFEDKVSYEKYQARIDSIKAGLAQQPLVPVNTLTCYDDPTTKSNPHSCSNSEGERLFDFSFGSDNPYGFTRNYRDTGLPGYGLSEEKTLSLDVDLDFQANRVHRFGAGVEFAKKEVTNLGFNGGVSTFFHNVYKVEPTIGALWVKDRMDIGELVLDVGMRFDYFDSDAEYPALPGLVFPFEPSNQQEIDRLCAAAPAQGETTCQPKFITQDPVWTVSPRLGVAFPISDATNFRLSYGHFFQVPGFQDLFSNLTTDLRRSNTNSRYGRPIDAQKAVQFEIGLSHLFNPYTALDVTAYNKDKLSDITYRIDTIEWPASMRGTQDGRVLTNLDFGNAKGVDVRLTRRYAEYFTAIAGYSYTNSKSTGSDPTSYISSFGRFTDPITGAPLSPAQALQSADFDQTHRFTVATTAAFGNDVLEGTNYNPLLRNTNVAMTLQAGSGFPWTRSSSPGERGRGATGARYTELINSSRLPWNYNVDGRLQRGFEIGDQKLSAFVNVFNLLDTRNQTNVYGVTGSPIDPGDIKAVSTAGISKTDVVIADATSPVSRLSFERQQAMLDRYGMADADPNVLSVQEQVKLRGLNYIHSQNLPANFSAPRTWRVGIEWVF